MKQVLIIFTIIVSASAGKVWKFATNYAVNVMNFRPELLVVDLKTEPISLAVLGLTGFFDAKEDMDKDYTWEVLITNRGNEGEVSYNFPPSSTKDFFEKVWKRNFKKDMEKCSNMPLQLPFKKRKYLWFKCLFSSLSIDFLEVTSRDPQRYQKMEININKKREPVSRITFHLWGILEDYQAPLGVYNLYNSYFVSDARG